MRCRACDGWGNSAKTFLGASETEIYPKCPACGGKGWTEAEAAITTAPERKQVAGEGQQEDRE